MNKSDRFRMVVLQNDRRLLCTVVYYPGSGYYSRRCPFALGHARGPRRFSSPLPRNESERIPPWSEVSPSLFRCPTGWSGHIVAATSSGVCPLIASLHTEESKTRTAVPRAVAKRNLSIASSAISAGKRAPNLTMRAWSSSTWSHGLGVHHFDVFVPRTESKPLRDAPNLARAHFSIPWPKTVLFSSARQLLRHGTLSPSPDEPRARSGRRILFFSAVPIARWSSSGAKCLPAFLRRRDEIAAAVACGGSKSPESGWRKNVWRRAEQFDASLLTKTNIPQTGGPGKNCMPTCFYDQLKDIHRPGC